MRFETDGLTFEVDWLTCDNPDCTCTDITFKFTECTATGHAAGVHLKADIDISTGHVAAKTSSLARPIAEAFARQERTGLFPNLLRVKAEDGHLAHFVMDRQDIDEGNLISYQVLVAGDRSVMRGGDRISFPVQHQGTTYFIDDLYCPRPGCACEDVHVVGFGLTKDKAETYIAAPIFEGIVTLRGKVTIEHLHEPFRSRAQAMDIVATWKAQYPTLLRELRRRHHAVKEVAERSLKASSGVPAAKPAAVVQPPVRLTAPELGVGSAIAAPAPRHAVPVAAGKVGRNDPCPCSSGKKYKKCCGP